jgi:hypothetical protein
MNKKQKMENFGSFGAIEPRSLTAEIICLITGQLSPKLKTLLLNKNNLPLNEIDSKKIITMHWDFLTLAQLLTWIGEDSLETKAKVLIVKEITHSSQSKKVLGFEKYDSKDISCRDLITSSRSDDLLILLETLIDLELLDCTKLDIKNKISNLIANKIEDKIFISED